LQQLIEKTRSKSQAIVSGFGYLIYAAYLAEVEHKTSPIYSRFWQSLPSSTAEISVRSANGPKLADEERLGNGPLNAVAKSSAQ